MLTIGSLLKEKRIEKNLSVEAVAEITKLPISHIIAIDNGDIEPFSKDLSYLSYYIRHYANAVGVDYEEIRAEVNKVTAEWTQTIDIVATPEERDKSAKHSRPKRIKKRVDYSFLAFVTASILLVVLFIYLGIRYIPDLLASDPIEKPEISTPEVPDVKPPVDVPNPPVVESPLKIVSEDDLTYKILNWTEGDEMKFEVKFGAAKTWIAVYLDGNVVSEPVSKIYVKGEAIPFTTESKADRKVMFHFGMMANNEIYLNGTKVELTESTANTKGVAKVTFVFAVDEGE